MPTESAWSSSELISNKASIVGTGGGGGLEGVGAGADPVLEFAPALASAAAGGLELLGLGVGRVDWVGSGGRYEYGLLLGILYWLC